MGFFGFFNKEKKTALDKGLEKSKQGVFDKLARIVAGKDKVDDDVLDDLEEVLITSDVGVDTTLKIIDRIEKRVARDKYMNTSELNNILRDEGSSGDQSIFKAVLIPYAVNYVLDEDMTATNRKNIFNYILANTKMMWSNLDLSRYPIVFCNYSWRYPYTGTDENASMGAMCSGTSLMENTARMCRAIVDRYELGTLLTQTNNLVIEQGHENDEELSPFYAARQAATEIMDAPSNYTTYQFRKAIQNLEAAYQAAQDYATGIAAIQNSNFKLQGEVYDLSGRKVASEKLTRGLYIIGGRKVMIK